jgi:hypothetical protein
MGHGIIWTKDRGTGASKQYLAITEDGNLPYGKVVIRDANGIDESSDSLTCADIETVEGTRVPISLRLQ